MAELADSVLLSRSGLTRLVDRLQAAGLVVREPFPGDARGMYTVLTPAGLDRLRRAAPIHLAGVQEYWLSKFSDDELRQLHDLLNRLVADSEDSDITDAEDEASSGGRDQLGDTP
jgi:DNA-binding MarR family transcriptional regulator